MEYIFLRIRTYSLPIDDDGDEDDEDNEDDEVHLISIPFQKAFLSCITVTILLLKNRYTTSGPRADRYKWSYITPIHGPTYMCGVYLPL